MTMEERKRVIKIAQDFFNKHQLTMECNIEAKEFQAFYHILLDYQKLQKENEELTTALSKQSKDIGNYLVELQQKDKQIDLMGETIRKLAISLASYKGSYNKETINFTGSIKDVKQYFEKLAKEKKIKYEQEKR